MIKTLTACTREIDDAAVAIAEIKKTLDIEKNLLKNSLGIISCFTEFDESGVLKAICDALPFECIGTTSSLCAAGPEIDQIILVITVLTSDDCNFKTTAIPVDDGYKESINQRLSGFLNETQEKPVFFLSYFPLINAISGDMMLSAIDSVTGGIPLFGTAAIDHTMDYSMSKTIHNGQMFREAIVLGAVYGKPNFMFEIASIDESRIRSQKAIITKSNGNVLISVNEKTAIDYFEGIGVTKDELSIGLGIIPLVVDLKDGTKPVARAVFALTDEGYAVCGGIMPEGAALTIARIDKNDVLQTTENTLKPLVTNDGVILSYSCLARFLALGATNKAEAEKVRDVVGKLKYHYACSGGEICPLADAHGKFKNIYHNYTNVICKLW